MAVSTESGRGYRVGESATLPASGEGDVDVGGALYRVWRENGVSVDSIRPRAAWQNRRRGKLPSRLGERAARLGEDKPDTPGNEAGATLLVAGTEFSLGELLSAGTATVAGPAISEGVATRLTRLRRQAEVLVEVLDTSQALLGAELRQIWDRAQTAVDRIFGPGEVTLKRELRTTRVVAALQEVEAAMSSGTAFEEATAEGQGGLFLGSSAGPWRGAEVFGAVEWKATAVFAAVGGTRYGAVQRRVRRDGIAAGSLVLDIPARIRGLRLLNSRGHTFHERYFVCRNRRVCRRGRGGVRLRDALHRRDRAVGGLHHGAVRGLVWNLADTEGQPWRYQLQEVDRIVLPDARIGPALSGRRQGVRGRSANSVSFRVSRAFVRPSTFKGHLLGQGEVAGSEAVGVWSIGEERDGQLPGGRFRGDTYGCANSADSGQRPRGRATPI